MAKQKSKIWVYAYRPKWNKEGLFYSYLSFAPDESFENAETQLIGEQEIEFEVPDSYDFDAHVVESLQKQKQAVMAELQTRITEIDRQIQEHLALPMNMPEEGTYDL